MHTATLFLFSFFAGAVSTPAYRASLRLRRADDALVGRSDSLSEADAELPPLPLEFEEQEEIYMSIDDPRVGTVDEEGNVLVPVDEDGRILPGFEHLVRPFQDSDLNSESTGNIDDQTSVTKEETAAGSSDDAESSYDENAIDASASLLPTASDYVDSREADAEQDRNQKTIEAMAEKPNPTGSEGMFQKEDDAEVVNKEESEADAIDRLIEEIIQLAREKEMAEYGIFEEEGSDPQPSNPGGESSDSQPINPGEESSDSQPSNPDESIVDSIADEKPYDDAIADERPLIVAAPPDDSEEDDTRPQIGEGVGEVAKVLPVDEDKDDMDTTNLRKGDILEQGATEKAKNRPGSAALSSTLVSLIITVVLCVSIA